MKIESQTPEFQPFTLTLTFEEKAEVEKLFALFDSFIIMTALDYKDASKNICEQLKAKCTDINPQQYKEAIGNTIFEETMKTVITNYPTTYSLPSFI